ncbi:MAG: glycosyltransferase, partial [Chloroflexota bacterium]|nr:glycosyltransferase [Chloroflexota bacterium]
PHLLASVRRLRPAPHEVIVVDDDSADGTTDVAAAFGATVMRSEPPPGWLGKPFACHLGAGAATGTHLLFLDADVWLAPQSLAMLAAEHGSRGGLVSVQPHHTPGAYYEELSAYFNAVAMMGTGAFSPRPPAKPVAFGPCLFTSAAEYQRVGGHDSVRHELLEDVALAHRYSERGLPISCFAGADHVRFRMYPGGVHQLIEGWTKNIASGATAADRLAVAGTVLWISAHAAVAVSAGAGIARSILTRSVLPRREVAAWALIAAHQRWLLGRVGSFRVSTAVGFPVPLAAFLAIFTRSTVLTRWRHAVTWRGRSISLPGRDRR